MTADRTQCVRVEATHNSILCEILESPTEQRSRGLISAQPEPDYRELYEGEEVGRTFLVMGGDAPRLLDLIEEQFDLISVAAEKVLGPVDKRRQPKLCGCQA